MMRGPTLGLLGASGSSSQGLTMAAMLPISSLKKYVPPRPSEEGSGSCQARSPATTDLTRLRTPAQVCAVPTTSRRPFSYSACSVDAT